MRARRERAGPVLVGGGGGRAQPPGGRPAARHARGGFDLADAPLAR